MGRKRIFKEFRPHKCAKCGKKATKENTGVRRSGVTKLFQFDSYCKKCRHEKNLKYAREHPEVQKAWREKNTDHLKQYAKEYRKTHKEDLNKNAARWYKKNRETRSIQRRLKIMGEAVTIGEVREACKSG